MAKSDRTVLLVEVEQTPGTPRTAGPMVTSGVVTGGFNGFMTAVPLYNVQNPTQPQGETLPLDRKRATLGPEAPGLGIPRYATDAQFYVYGSGVPSVPPPWAMFLRAAGFAETRYVDSTQTAPDPTTTINLTETTGGNLTLLKTYNYKFSTVDSNGVETVLSAVKSVTLTGSNNAVTIDGLNTGDFAGKRVLIWRTAGDGSTYNLVADVPDGVADITDIVADTQRSPVTRDESGTTAQVIWLPKSDNFEALTIQTFIDAYKLLASGVRLSLDFTGNAGEYFQGAVSAQGQYAAGVIAANPTTGVVNPGVPPKVAGANILSITPSGGAAINPVFKSVGINIGTQLSDRRDGNIAAVLKEIAITQKFDPHITCQVEVNTSERFWPDDFDAGTDFQFELTVGPATAGNRIVMGTVQSTQAWASETAYVRLAAMPSLDDSEGFKVWNLDFQPVEGVAGNNWIYLRQY